MRWRTSMVSRVTAIRVGVPHESQPSPAPLGSNGREPVRPPDATHAMEGRAVRQSPVTSVTAKTHPCEYAAGRRKPPIGSKNGARTVAAEGLSPTARWVMPDLRPVHLDHRRVRPGQHIQQLVTARVGHRPRQAASTSAERTVRSVPLFDGTGSGGNGAAMRIALIALPASPPRWLDALDDGARGPSRGERWEHISSLHAGERGHWDDSHAVANSARHPIVLGCSRGRTFSRSFLPAGQECDDGDEHQRPGKHERCGGADERPQQPRNTA